MHCLLLTQPLGVWWVVRHPLLASKALTLLCLGSIIPYPARHHHLCGQPLADWRAGMQPILILILIISQGSGKLCCSAVHVRQNGSVMASAGAQARCNLCAPGTPV